MILSKSLLITILNISIPLFGGITVSHQSMNRCQEIQVSWSKRDTTGGLGNGIIDLEFAGDRSQYAVYVLTAGGKTKLKSTEISIRNLKKGKHGVVITGEKEGLDFCQKFFEVVIN